MDPSQLPESTNLSIEDRALSSDHVSRSALFDVQNYVGSNSRKSSWNFFWILFGLIVLVILSICLFFFFSIDRQKGDFKNGQSEIKQIVVDQSSDQIDYSSNRSDMGKFLYDTTTPATPIYQITAGLNPSTPILPRLDNPLARQSNQFDRQFFSERNQLEILVPKSPFIGQQCSGNLFDGEGAVCDRGHIRVNYFYRCDQPDSQTNDLDFSETVLSDHTSLSNDPIDRCRSGSVCLAGVCTVIPNDTGEIFLQRHPFKLFRESSILSPNWWPLKNILTVIQGKELYQYYFFQDDTENNQMRVWLGSDLLDQTIEPVQLIYQNGLIRLKSLCQIPPNLLTYLNEISETKISGINYLGVDSDGDLYLIELINLKQMAIKPYKFLKKDSLMTDWIDQQIVNDVQSSSDGSLLIVSDQGSYLISSKYSEEFISSVERNSREISPLNRGESTSKSFKKSPINGTIEKFEGSFACSVQDLYHFTLLLDNSIAYYHKSDLSNNSWSRYTLPGKFSSVAFSTTIESSNAVDIILVESEQGEVVKWNLRIGEPFIRATELSKASLLIKQDKESVNKQPESKPEKMIIWHRSKLKTVPAKQLVRTWNQLFILSSHQRITVNFPV